MPVRRRDVHHLGTEGQEMKSYHVTVKAVVMVAARDKKSASRIAIESVGFAPGLLMVEYITDGYETVANLDDEPEKPVAFPDIKNLDPEEIF